MKTNQLKAIFTLMIASVLLVGFMTVKRETVNEDFDVATSGATENLTRVQVFGEFSTVQVFYTGLDAADGTIGFTQSLDGNNFDELNGSTGTLDNTKNSHTFNITALRTDYLRPLFTKGSNTSGTITKIVYNFDNY